MSLFWVSLNILFAFFTGGPVAGLGMAVLSAVTFHTARRKWGAVVKTNNHFTLILSDDEDDDAPRAVWKDPALRTALPRPAVRPRVRRVLSWSDAESD